MSIVHVIIIAIEKAIDYQILNIFLYLFSCKTFSNIPIPTQPALLKSTQFKILACHYAHCTMHMAIVHVIIISIEKVME